MQNTSKKKTRRYWRRTSTPKPWWPWGIAPLAGLGAIFLFGALFIAPRIEADVRDGVSHRIDAAGLPAMDVRSDGQGVTINTLAQADQELYVRALAESTRCDTWAGQLACPTTVDVRRIEQAAAPALLKSRPHRFTAERIDHGVRLTGEVPNQEEHDRILGVARQHFGDITNSLSISNESAGTHFAQAANQALAVASRLTSGKASWSGEALAVDGSARSGAIGDVRAQFAAIGNESFQGDFNVRSLFDSQQCNMDFEQILGHSSIRFQTGSASIDSGNDELLGRLAELAQSCPGKLSIQGHTDSQGDAEKNQALSLSRATAVLDALVSRGIDADRIAAAGYGESRPIADNSTSAGRAKNRRIAITIDSMN
ncbi:MAG: OmpA family protein [Woeseiaceae bacterium]|nr:OmpA family protein [Woeseiaceae bacterium]